MLDQRQQLLEQIKKAQNILIVFNRNWQTDAVATALGLYLFLKKLGKNIDVAAEKNDLHNLAFLPGASEIKNKLDNLRKFIISLNIAQTKVSQIKYKMEESNLNFIISPQNGFFTPEDISTSSGGFQYDLIITISSPDLESLGTIYDNDTEFFYQTSIINIDHNPANEDYGQINYVDLNAVASAEIVFNLLNQYKKENIDENIATCLYAGIITETKSFKTANVTPATLNATSELIALGARKEEIINHFYRSRSLNVLKLWGKVLSNLTNNGSKRLIWSQIKAEDFKQTNTQAEDLPDIIDELIVNIPEAKIIVIFYEIAGEIKTTKAFVYTTRNFNALELVKDFNPKGTKNLASLELVQDLDLTSVIVIKLITEKISRMNLE